MSLLAVIPKSVPAAKRALAMLERDVESASTYDAGCAVVIGALRLDLFRGARPFAGDVIRFPPRGGAIWLTWREGEGWLMVAGSHGWSFGSRSAALAAARWLSANLGLPVREAPP